MRLIDADALIEEIGKEIDEAKKAPLCDYCAGMKNVIGIVKNQDSVDPVKHGHWKFAKDVYISCSVCDATILLFNAENPNYCPRCGAKMDGEQNVSD